MKKIANTSLIKRINYNLIWDYLLDKKSTTIPNISEEIGLSLPTVTRAIEYGLNLGMVMLDEIADSTGGRKAQIYRLNVDYEHFLLISYDNNTLYYRVTNFSGNIILKEQIQTTKLSLIKDIDKIIGNSLNDDNLIRKVAVSFTGVINDGQIIDCWAIQRLNGFNFENYFQNKYNIYIKIINNIQAATIACVRHVNNYDKKIISLFEYGHTGYGAGVIMKGKLLEGANGAAGEIAQIPTIGGSKSLINMYAFQIVSIISVINPHTIVLYPDDSKVSINKIFEIVNERIPEYSMPEFIFAENFLNDCFNGLFAKCITQSKKELEI